MALAMATGRLLAVIPYMSHKRVPRVKSAYMGNEIPEVSFVRMVFTAWGKNEKVVPQAAQYPIMAIVFKFISSFYRLTNVQ
jgi:hypothetical protein